MKAELREGTGGQSQSRYERPVLGTDWRNQRKLVVTWSQVGKHEGLDGTLRWGREGYKSFKTWLSRFRHITIKYPRFRSSPHTQE